MLVRRTLAAAAAVPLAVAVTASIAAPVDAATHHVPSVSHLKATPDVESVALSWTSPKSSTVKHLVIRLAKGRPAPAKVTSGTKVATVPRKTQHVTVTKLAPKTTYSFSVFALDSHKHASERVSVTSTTKPLPPPPYLSMFTLPSARAHSSYRAQLTTYGNEPATYAVSSGALPAGITLSRTGLLSGTPTTAGTSSFQVVATDRYGQHSPLQSLSITIYAADAWLAAEGPPPKKPDGRIAAGLEHVACPSSSLCIATGSYNDESYQPTALLATFNGSTWSATAPPVPKDPAAQGATLVHASGCASATTCVGYGEYYYRGPDSVGSRPLIEQYAGGSWTAVEAPLPTGAPADTDAVLQAGACTSGMCVAGGWAAPQYMSSSTYTAGVLVSGNGSSWQTTAATLPGDADTTRFPIFTSAGCGSGECVLAGYYPDTSGHDHVLLETWNGSSWTGTSPALPTGADTTQGQPPTIFGVACPSAGQCRAVGAYQAAGHDQPLLLTGSGGSWSASTLPLPSDSAAGISDAVLSAISCPDAGDCVATGYTEDATSGTGGIIETLSGGSWSAIDAPEPASGATISSIPAVVCPAVGACFAFGSGSQIAASDTPFVLSLASGHWSIAPLTTPAGQQPGSGLSAAACLTATHCVGVGTYQDGQGDGLPMVARNW